MKKYIKPTAKVVEIRLMGSCLDDFKMNQASFATDDVHSASRYENNRFDWDDDDE